MGKPVSRGGLAGGKTRNTCDLLSGGAGCGMSGVEEGTTAVMLESDWLELLPCLEELGGVLASVMAAGLTLNAQSTPASAVVTLSPIFSDWKELGDDARSAPLATWSAFFGTTPTITFGSVAANQTVTRVGYFDWDITTLVKSWQDRSLANCGLLLQAPGPQGAVGNSRYRYAGLGPRAHHHLAHSRTFRGPAAFGA